MAKEVLIFLKMLGIFFKGREGRSNKTHKFHHKRKAVDIIKGPHMIMFKLYRASL